MLHSIVTQSGACAVLAACLYALVAGSWRERLCGGMYLIGYIAQVCFMAVADRPAVDMFIVDILCLPPFLIASRQSPHPWLWLAVVGQAASLVADLTALGFTGLSRWTYLTIEIVASYSVLLALTGATVSAQLRRRREKAAAGLASDPIEAKTMQAPKGRRS
ncbi:hypothetical protein [Asticcacaulis solisilvae]|uniref:hypothetical protein n=1 Tax=Asticcacaulis solisilvae TaxID=1217274 RepID=UPI003FD80C01